MNRRMVVLFILVLLGTALFQACNRNISTSPAPVFIPLEAKSQSIARAAGGSLVLSDGTSVQVPPDGFDRDSTVTITKMQASSAPGMGSGLLPLKYVYYFNSGGAAFTGNVTLVFGYKVSDIPSGHSETDLQVVYNNGSSWVVVPSSLDTTLKQKTVVTNHFSPWELVVPEGTASDTPTPESPTNTPTISSTPTGTWYTPTPIPSNTPNPYCTPFAFITPTATYSCGPLPPVANLTEREYFETEICPSVCPNWTYIDCSPDLNTNSFFRDTIYGHITATGNGDPAFLGADSHFYYFYTGSVTGNNVVLDCMGGNQYQLIVNSCLGNAVTFGPGPVTYTGSQPNGTLSVDVAGFNGNPGPFRLSVWVDPFVPTVTATPTITEVLTPTPTFTPTP